MFYIRGKLEGSERPVSLFPSFHPLIPKTKTIEKLYCIRYLIFSFFFLTGTIRPQLFLSLFWDCVWNKKRHIEMMKSHYVVIQCCQIVTFFRIFNKITFPRSPRITGYEVRFNSLNIFFTVNTFWNPSSIDNIFG